MKLVNVFFDSVVLLEPKVFGDHRGYFMETYNQKTFADLGINNVFVQDNQSFTLNKNTIRGVHFQRGALAQAKLLRVTRGAIKDLAVDLRRGSPTYLRWAFAELNDENRRMLFIPRGFGHAFITLTDNVEVCYKVDNFYSPEHDRSVRYDDPQIGVQWQTASPILSEKDAQAPLLAESDCDFTY